MKLNYQHLCEQVCKIAKDAGSFIRTEAKNFDRSKIEYKGLHNLVSYVDKATENMIIEELDKLLPNAAFVAEESFTVLDQSLYKWIIDPLDGTTNFTHGLPCYCVSIALLEGDKLVVGVVYEVNLDECFYTWLDAPSYMNGARISVSSINKINQSLIATGFPYTDYSRASPYMEVFDYCMVNSHGLRRLGSACADIVYVAMGRLEAFYEYGLKPWDVAAGALIVENAGGTVTDFKGGNDFIFGEEIITSNTHIHAEFLTVVKEKFEQKK
ncbi:MAG: inositol monophosphatase [Bacteroidetes bacterium]|nr:inositol monophosphatase [Bacteroidota bacterium]